MAFVEGDGLAGKNLPGGVNSLDVAFNGSSTSSITFRMTGLVYIPNGQFNIGGAINHATNSDYGSFIGQNCFTVYAQAIRLNGTIDIFDNPTVDCDRAGLEDLPKVPIVALLR
jgi:hypothetical protein